MFCIGVSFKKTPLTIREQFAFSAEEQFAFLSELIKRKLITGGVIVSTCNRSEMYFSGDVCQTEQIENQLAFFKRIKREHIKKYCLYYHEKKAVYHLFKVACGLDSMVLGEDEILHQMKEAYLFSDKQGFLDSELNIIFQGAFNCAKLSKSGTKISTTPISIGTLTANRIEKYIRENCADRNIDSRQNQKIANEKVLVIGATGKIGSIVVKDLIAKGISVIGTSRKRNLSDSVLFKEDKQMEWVDFEERYNWINHVAAIVSATTSPHYTLTGEAFSDHVEKGKSCLLIDLAVPFDIDREIGNLAGIELYDIDYFKQRSDENHNIRLEEVEKAEGIMERCVDDVLKKLYLRGFQSKMVDQYEEKWFQKMIYYLRDVLDSEQLLEVLDKIYRKEIHKGRE